LAEDKEKGLNHGMFAYLGKPVDVSKLEELLNLIEDEKLVA
jgi:hypothetical protein